MNPAIIFLSLIVWLVLSLLFAVWSARIAMAKKRDAAFWFFCGWGLGPISVAIATFALKPRDQIRHAERLRWYEHPAARAVLRFIMSTSVPTGPFVIAPLVAENPRTFQLAVIGVFLMPWLFFAGLAAMRGLLRFGGGPMGVARAVLDEAIRMKIAVAFIALLLLMVPIMPFVLSENEPVRYRVQSFLSYGFTTVTILLSIMTVFLACATLSFEITDKQIFTTAVKPISRGAYLFGKWMGIVALNAVLIGVASVAIYAFTTLYLAQMPPKDGLDRLAINDEILVARVVIEPVEPPNVDEMVDEYYQQRYAEAPDLVAVAGGELAVKRDVRNQVLAAWRTIGPLEQRTYVFEGLGGAGRYSNFIQLQYKVRAPGQIRDERLPMIININGRQVRERMRLNRPQTIRLPADIVDDNGRVYVTLRHPAELPNTLMIQPEGLQIYYQAGQFGPNFARGAAAMWVKLAFLAMLGLMASTFLGFPVACLLSFMICAAAFGSDYLLESVQGIRFDPEGRLNLFEKMMGWVAWMVASLLNKYGQFSPTAQIVEGRMFSTGDLMRCAFWIGVVWTGLTALLGLIIFRRRELARVQV